MLRFRFGLFLVLVITTFLLSGCIFSSGPANPTQPPTVPVSQTAMPDLTPVATATPRQMTVCIGEEPNTLYALGNPNDSALSVLSAIYDGPIDRNSYGFQPVILKKLPSLEDGDAVLAPVDVKKGMLVSDVNGGVVALDKGVKVLPSGCTSVDCAVEYDGVSQLKMDQWVVTYTLLDKLSWSDGTPLAASDSVYAYELAKDWASPNSKYLVDRTQSYEAVDDLSTQWWGIPGYMDPDYFANFFSPLPRHAWEAIGASDLVTAELSSRQPLGWGPYMVNEWLAGDHITLTKNPLYFRAAEGLPKIDTLVFRFVSDADDAIARLSAGDCDLVDSTVRLDGQVGLLQEMQNSGTLQFYSTTTNVMERLDFGIVPSSYDDAYAPYYGDRQAILSDNRTRQAIAMCLDRQKVVDVVLYGLSSVPDSFVPPEHPLYFSNVPAYPYDPKRAADLLREAGWIDDDDNPVTPRVALNVPDVANGTPLKLNYFTTNATQRRQVSGLLAETLTACGIQVPVSNYPPEEFYAPGPDGMVFGRNFDLAQFAMGTPDIEPVCGWFTTAQIPNADNSWVGTNVSGFSDGEYDTACQNARLAVPDSEARRTGYDRTQYIFAEELPSVPLYWRLKVAAARADMCNFALDATAYSDLWNVESLDYGSGCQ